jgi:DNA gyrase/topoisomerase IV subunit A
MQVTLNVQFIEYKTQNRGGVGQKSAGTRDQDFLEHMFVATNHQYMILYSKGKCFGCVFMKFGSKQPKVEPFKILSISKVMIAFYL